MYVIGVDPAWGKPSAWALLDYEREEEITVVESMRGEITDFADFLVKTPVSFVSIEDQFFYKNFDTVKKLCWSAGMFMAVCKMMEVPYESVNVASWKNYWKVSGKNAVYTPQALVRDQFGREYSDDAACAILIASYAGRMRYDKDHS